MPKAISAPNSTGITSLGSNVCSPGNKKNQASAWLSILDIRFEERPADFRKLYFHPCLDAIDRVDHFPIRLLAAHLRLGRNHQIRPELQRDQVEYLLDLLLFADEGADRIAQIFLGAFADEQRGDFPRHEESDDAQQCADAYRPVGVEERIAG